MLIDRLETDKDGYKWINQGVKTTNDRYYNTHQKSILSNTVTESNIYNNYSYTSCVNWVIEKTSQTPSKKLEFNIDKPETGLRKTDFNIITNNNEMNDMNDNKMDCHCDNPTNDMYSNINHRNVQPESTTHNSLYRLINHKLQLNYDLEESYRIDDWKSLNSHKGELDIAYNTKFEYKTLHPRVFYVLYIRPNDVDNGHLIYGLSTDQILVTKEYQSIHMPENLIEAISETSSSDNKIQVIHFNNGQAIIQDDQSNNHNKNGHIHINHTNNPEDESHKELNSSPQLGGMKPNKIVDQE